MNKVESDNRISSNFSKNIQYVENKQSGFARLHSVPDFLSV